MTRHAGHALLLVLGAIFIFHSPFTRWWADLGLPWYTVFVLWFGLIALVALDNRNAKSADDSDPAKPALGSRPLAGGRSESDALHKEPHSKTVNADIATDSNSNANRNTDGN